VLEKTKQSLEADKATLSAELEQASAARQEMERRRKQSEQQVQELTSRLAETERTKTDVSNKAAKLQVQCRSVRDTKCVIVLWLCFVCVFALKYNG